MTAGQFRLLLVLLWGCFSLSSLSAQESKSIDSLKAVIKAIPEGQDMKKAEGWLALTKIYISLSDYVNAATCVQNCMSIAEKLHNDTLIAKCYSNDGSIQMNQRNPSKAITYHTKALEIYNRIHDKPNQAMSIKFLGDDYLLHHDSSTAEKYYEQALSLFQALGDKHGEASVYLNQATVATSNYPKRIVLALAAKKIYDSFPFVSFLPTINIGNLGIVYSEIVQKKIYTTIHNDPNIPATEKGNIEKAEYYLQLAAETAIKRKDYDNWSFYTGALAELQEYKGDFKNAYYNIRKYYNTQDSIYSQDNKNKIADLEGKREVDLKNKEIINNQLQLSAERKNRNYLIGGLFLLGVIGMLLYWQSRTRKKTNNELLRLNKELDDANRVKARFFGILSHDLRSPMANLINFLRLQKREPGLLSAQQIQAQEQKITSSAESLLETMEAMLLWSKGQMEQFKPQISTVQVDDLFTYLRKYFTGPENIQFDFSNEQHLTVQTDENYLKSIMLNLTANAVRALGKTPNPQIRWRAWQETNSIYLSIKDNGPGASDEQLRALYDESASSGGKHGLGLHIIRDLAKAIDCTVNLKSHDATGTEFVLSIQVMPTK